MLPSSFLSLVVTSLLDTSSVELVVLKTRLPFIDKPKIFKLENLISASESLLLCKMLAKATKPPRFELDA
jgi:hypothetical protein